MKNMEYESNWSNRANVKNIYLITLFYGSLGYNNNWLYELEPMNDQQ